MRSIFTIAVKDFKSLVFSPTFMLIAALCSVLWSYSFIRVLLNFANRSTMSGMSGMTPELNIHYSVFIQHISFVNLIFIFAIPAITMRLLSEEKKMRTYDLLLTSPITSANIAIGKFFAGWVTALVLVLISFLYPLGTALISDFSWAPVISSYLGLALMAAIYVAVGLFASSLSESVVLSVILGVILNLVLWFISQGSEFSDNTAYVAFMDHINIGQQFFSFLKGTYKISAIVFFATFVSFFIFMTERVVEASRWRS